MPFDPISYILAKNALAKGIALPTLKDLVIDTDKDWGGYRIKNLGEPVDPNDPARKIYVDVATTGLGINLFLLDAADSEVTEYKATSIEVPELPEAYVEYSTADAGDYEIGAWIAPADLIPVLKLGVYEFHCQTERPTGDIPVRLFFRLYERKSDGSEVLIGESMLSDRIDSRRDIIVSLILANDYVMASGSRLVFKLYARYEETGASATTVRVYYQGNVRSRLTMPTVKEILDTLYAAKLHASQHALGGEDELSLDASQITSGVLSVDRIPDLSRSKITDFFSSPFWDNIPDKPFSTLGSEFTVSAGELQINSITRSKISDLFSSPFWDNIPDKPSTFPPEAHTHGISDLTDFVNVSKVIIDTSANRPAAGVAGRLFFETDTHMIYYDDGTSWVKLGVADWGNIDGKPSKFPPEAHTHSVSDVTFDGSVTPPADNTYDLGSSSYRWRDLFVARDAVLEKIWSYPDMILSEDDIGLTAYVSLVGGTAYVAPMFDNTVVYVNGKFVGVVNRGSRLSVSVSAGDIISANKPIMVHSSDERHTPITWADTKFVIPFYRNDPQTIYIYAPFADASVDVYVGTSTTAATTVTVTKGTATSVDVDVTPPNTVILESNAPIVVAVASNNQTYDFRFIHPPAKDLIGIPSNSLYVSALEDNTTITWYQGNNSGTYTLNRGEIVSHSDLGISTGSQYNATPVRVIADKPIMISSFADGDGTDATCGLPLNKLGTLYALPVAAQWLSIAVPFDNTRIRIYEGGTLKYETTVSNTYTYNTPVLLYLNPTDIDSNWSDIPAGVVIESDKPIMIVYDCAEAWTDDETVMLGINHRKFRIYENDVLSLVSDIVPPIDATYDLGTSSYRWRKAYLGSFQANGADCYIDAYGLVIGNTSGRASGERLELYGPNSSMILSVQDGNGRIQMKWNATRGTNETFLVGGENAGMWEFDPVEPETGLFKVRFADGSNASAGDAISWQDILQVGTSGMKLFKSGFYPGSDNALDIGSSSLRWRDIYIAGSIHFADGTSLSSGNIKFGNNVVTLVDHGAPDSNTVLHDTGSGGSATFHSGTVSDADKTLVTARASFRFASRNGTGTIKLRLDCYAGDDETTYYDVTASTSSTSWVNVTVHLKQPIIGRGLNWSVIGYNVMVAWEYCTIRYG